MAADAKFATDDRIPEWEKGGYLGFGYYDKEAKQNVHLSHFKFVVLEAYVGVSGFDGESRSWSNRVQNSKYEPLTVMSSNSNGPVAQGLYQQIKGDLPKGAHYTKFLKVYAIDLKQVAEIELTVGSERGMQAAVAAATNEKNPEKVYINGLPKNDHLFGFVLTGYRRVTMEGNDYSGKGDLYFDPVFHCGIVNPAKSPELHAECVVLQSKERAEHEAYKAKYETATPVITTQPAPIEYVTPPPPATAAPAAHPAPAGHNDIDDDLPF